MVIAPSFIPEDGESPDDIRRIIAAVEIHELTGQDALAEV